MEAILDPVQAVVAAYRYDPFGRLLAQSGSLTQPFGFSTKRYIPQIGMLHYQYRNYLPEIGRWTTRDPLGEAGGVNLYAFVGNNPVNWVDPDGRTPSLAATGIGALLGGFSGFAGEFGNQLTSSFLNGTEIDWGSVKNFTVAGVVGGATLGTAVGLLMGDPSAAGAALLYNGSLSATMALSGGAAFAAGNVAGILNNIDAVTGAAPYAPSVCP